MNLAGLADLFTDSYIEMDSDINKSLIEALDISCDEVLENEIDMEGVD